jgi:hypothetical protein
MNDPREMTRLTRPFLFFLFASSPLSSNKEKGDIEIKNRRRKKIKIIGH